MAIQEDSDSGSTPMAVGRYFWYCYKLVQRDYIVEIPTLAIDRILPMPYHILVQRKNTFDAVQYLRNSA